MRQAPFGTGRLIRKIKAKTDRGLVAWRGPPVQPATIACTMLVAISAARPGVLPWGGKRAGGQLWRIFRQCLVFDHCAKIARRAAPQLRFVASFPFCASWKDVPLHLSPGESDESLLSI